MTRFLVVVLAVSIVVSTALTGCAAVADPAPSESRDSNVTRVAFYGDSYTLGTGASDLALRWSTIVCAERDWSEFNPSVNGLGFINNRGTFGPGDLPDLVIADRPDIVFITMGLNDNFSFDRASERIAAQISDDFTRLKSALPDARFIVVEPFWYTDERPASVETIIGWVKEAAADIGAGYIAGASHWIEGHPEFMASDGLHPNDVGYARMAEHMNVELGKLGL